MSRLEFGDDISPVERHLWKLISAIDDDDVNALLHVLPSCTAVGYVGLVNFQLFDLTEAGPPEEDNQLQLRYISSNFQMALRQKTSDQSLVQILRRGRKLPLGLPYYPDARNLKILILGSIFEVACRSGRVNIVECFLSDTYHCPVSKTEKKLLDDAFDFRKAIVCASEAGYLEVVRLLLTDRRVDPSTNKGEALHNASRNGHVDVVKLLLTDNRVDASDCHDYALRLACIYGHVEVVKVLLADNRVEPAGNRSEALRVASRGGFTEVVKVLLAYTNPSPSTKESVLVRLARWRRYDHVANKLMKNRRVDPAADDNEAIRRAAAGGHLEVMECLLADSRVDPCALDNVALREAVRMDQQQVVKLLLPRVVVDRSLFKQLGFSEKEDESSTAMCELVLVSHLQFWPQVIGSYDAAHGASGSARAALGRIEAHSSLLLLLCVKRNFSPTVAGRVSDVLRDVCDEWLRFRYEYLALPVEATDS
jgi:ankyrin repeat protein